MKQFLKVEKTNVPGNGTCYSMYGLDITLHDEYLIWDRKFGMWPETLKVAYSNIDGVSVSPYGSEITIIINGRRHGWQPVFKHGLTSYEVSRADLQAIADAIDEKRFRKQDEKSKDYSEEKRVQATESNVAPVINANINPNNVEPTITRIEMFLEDQEWSKAEAYANAALDYFPADYRLYLALLCVEARVKTPNELREKNPEYINDSKNYQKVLRFADENTITELKKEIFSDSDNTEHEEGNEETNNPENGLKSHSVSGYSFMIPSDYREGGTIIRGNTIITSFKNESGHEITIMIWPSITCPDELFEFMAGLSPSKQVISDWMVNMGNRVSLIVDEYDATRGTICATSLAENIDESTKDYLIYGCFCSAKEKDEIIDIIKGVVCSITK